jgi:hypothetical protein
MPLAVRGKCLVQASYQDRTLPLTLVVVQGVGRPLLGIQWIKNLRIDLNHLIDGSQVSQRPLGRIYDRMALEAMLSHHKAVFDKDLGHCIKVLAHIQLKPDAIPKFFKPRPMSFAFINDIKDKIRRNVDAGILQHVDTSPWPAPIIPVRKASGQIRICGDFKVTMNTQILVDQHPISSIDELLTNLNNGEQFTKLDLSDIYLQIELDENSKQLTVIDTPLGLFRYNRMSFGIANAPAIFQRLIDQIIAGIPGWAAYPDDIIIITDATEMDHFNMIDRVLSKLAEFGFRCNLDKCSFHQPQVSYLGYIIDRHGKRPDTGRVTTVQNLPTPTNVKQSEAFLAKLDHYGKFVPHLSTLCNPLNRLRQRYVQWTCSSGSQSAFQRLKRHLAEATTLVHFDA